jgi:hypothetical protein
MIFRGHVEENSKHWSGCPRSIGLNTFRFASTSRHELCVSQVLKHDVIHFSTMIGLSSAFEDPDTDTNLVLECRPSSPTAPKEQRSHVLQVLW